MKLGVFLVWLSGGLMWLLFYEALPEPTAGQILGWFISIAVSAIPLYFGIRRIRKLVNKLKGSEQNG